MPEQEDHFTLFKQSIASNSLPERFTFPFYYQPHPLCLLAAQELQSHLESQTDWQHNFNVTGKMFGVLLVKNKQGKVGYLSAFSGKIADSNHLPKFVPPVFDMLAEEGFFRIGQAEITQISDHIKVLELNPEIVVLADRIQAEKASSLIEIQAHRDVMIEGRKVRKQQRLAAENNNNFVQIKEQLSKESIKHKNQLRDLKQLWQQRINKAQQAFDQLTAELSELKVKRKALSNSLQEKLFEQYRFLNQNGLEKSLYDIFRETEKQTPPAGAGECATPKLLHTAFKNDLEPLAMAEFWWGVSPQSEIRQHKNFYTACLGKCKPILAHMLEGIEQDENLLLKNLAAGKEIEIIYQDDVMVVINKPAELLSVPGKEIEDSVYYRMKHHYPEATGALIVHRLDMSTSGLMVIALSKQAHKNLQKQFINRTVKKRYIALLDGELEQDEGIIDLPLRVDLDDRPRQLVCYDYGRAAQTKWQVISCKNKQTRVHFYPISGRTHQLRVHSAHINGLNMSIVGDDLYGTSASRLHLHAESLALHHPITKDWMEFKIDADF
ncbi:MAG: RNA pseudouridine synthase [Piscirickettsiaceae bacterium]|nr:RNA pseudouridine synthase [Piscirickettsiaceae bacterium]